MLSTGAAVHVGNKPFKEEYDIEAVVIVMLSTGAAVHVGDKPLKKNMT